MENFSKNCRAVTDPSIQMQIMNQSDQNNGNTIDHTALYLSSFPTGYRFMPTDVELVVHYLAKKLRNQPLPRNLFVEVDLYEFHPRELVIKHRTQGEGEWYFFSPRNKKYPNGTRPSRHADIGYWRATGANKPVCTNNKEVVGHKQALVFYEGKAPNGVKTNWMMHEYVMHNPPQRQRVDPDDMKLNDCVLCKIYEGKNRKRSLEEESSNDQNSPKKRHMIESGDSTKDVDAEKVETQNDNGFLETLGTTKEDANAERSKPLNGNNSHGALGTAEENVDVDDNIINRYFDVDKYIEQCSTTDDSLSSSTTELLPSCSDINPLPEMSSLQPSSSDRNLLRVLPLQPSSSNKNLPLRMPSLQPFSSYINHSSRMPSSQPSCSYMNGPSTLPSSQSFCSYMKGPSMLSSSHPSCSFMDGPSTLSPLQPHRLDMNPLQPVHSYMNCSTRMPLLRPPHSFINFPSEMSPRMPPCPHTNGHSGISQFQPSCSNIVPPSGMPTCQPSRSNINMKPPSKMPYSDRKHPSQRPPF